MTFLSKLAFDSMITWSALSLLQRNENQLPPAPRTRRTVTKVRDSVVSLDKDENATNRKIKNSGTLLTQPRASQKSKKFSSHTLLSQRKSLKNKRTNIAAKIEKIPNLVAAVAAALKSDLHLSELATALTKGASEKAVHHILTNDLGLITKSACYEPKLLSPTPLSSRIVFELWASRSSHTRPSALIRPMPTFS